MTYYNGPAGWFSGRPGLKPAISLAGYALSVEHAEGAAASAPGIPGTKLVLSKDKSKSLLFYCHSDREAYWTKQFQACIGYADATTAYKTAVHQADADSKAKAAAKKLEDKDEDEEENAGGGGNNKAHSAWRKFTHQELSPNVWNTVKDAVSTPQVHSAGDDTGLLFTAVTAAAASDPEMFASSSPGVAMMIGSVVDPFEDLAKGGQDTSRRKAATALLAVTKLPAGSAAFIRCGGLVALVSPRILKAKGSVAIESALSILGSLQPECGTMVPSDVLDRDIIVAAEGLVKMAEAERDGSPFRLRTILNTINHLMSITSLRAWTAFAAGGGVNAMIALGIRAWERAGRDPDVKSDLVIELEAAMYTLCQTYLYLPGVYEGLSDRLKAWKTCHADTTRPLPPSLQVLQGGRSVAAASGGSAPPTTVAPAGAGAATSPAPSARALTTFRAIPGVVSSRQLGHGASRGVGVSTKIAAAADAKIDAPAFLRACGDGDLMAVRRLVDSLKATQPDGSTAVIPAVHAPMLGAGLLAAIDGLHIGVVASLLAAGAPQTATAEGGKATSALAHAFEQIKRCLLSPPTDSYADTDPESPEAKCGSACAIITALCRSGANPDESIDGHTAVWWTMNGGKANPSTLPRIAVAGPVLRTLAKAGASMNQKMSKAGGTPLTMAMTLDTHPLEVSPFGDNHPALQWVRLLLEIGASANASDEDGMPALVVATMKFTRDPIPAAKLLIAAGAKAELCLEAGMDPALLRDIMSKGSATPPPAAPAPAPPAPAPPAPEPATPPAPAPAKPAAAAAQPAKKACWLEERDPEDDAIIRVHNITGQRWREWTDENDGSTYYEDEATGETTWDLPAP